MGAKGDLSDLEVEAAKSSLKVEVDDRNPNAFNATVTLPGRIHDVIVEGSLS